MFAACVFARQIPKNECLCDFFVQGRNLSLHSRSAPALPNLFQRERENNSTDVNICNRVLTQRNDPHIQNLKYLDKECEFVPTDMKTLLVARQNENICKTPPLHRHPSVDIHTQRKSQLLSPTVVFVVVAPLLRGRQTLRERERG